MNERRIIRIRYAVKINGKEYSCPGFDAGETILPECDTGNAIAAVCHALDINCDEFTERYGELGSWSTHGAWERAGIVFDYCEEI